MTFGVLQKMKDHFWPTGKVNVPETRSSHLSPSEIDLVKQRLRANSDAAMARQRERGKTVNPRIAAARANGANV
uniref:Uncharacterized protein n=1 Tax=Rhizobium leguminosarum bv. trifolii TaxID=386 RepID=A0A1C9HX39_RHILT|nr:hypothetical protein [Rhizobium leguminosarum bv. trifolii]